MKKGLIIGVIVVLIIIGSIVGFMVYSKDVQKVRGIIDCGVFEINNDIMDQYEEPLEYFNKYPAEGEKLSCLARNMKECNLAKLTYIDDDGTHEVFINPGGDLCITRYEFYDRTSECDFAKEHYENLYESGLSDSGGETITGLRMFFSLAMIGQLYDEGVQEFPTYNSETNSTTYTECRITGSLE